VAKAEKEYDLQTALELAVVAQRVNGSYLKDTEAIPDEAGKVIVEWKHKNKDLIQYAIGAYKWQGSPALPNMTVTDEDRKMVSDIRQYFKRLVFHVMADSDNKFQQEVLMLLNNPTVKDNQFGIVACLPSTYLRDKKQTDLKKTLRNEILAPVGASILDLDGEILSIKYSEKFNCWNVTAQIDNCIASWMSSKQLEIGPCVLVKAKVKGHGVHWLYKKAETRLNYVKVAQ
jgi:hypothetical protein